MNAHFSRWHSLCLSTLIISGILPWVLQYYYSHNNETVFHIVQWSGLLHLITAVLSLCIVPRDYWRHIKKTLLFRRPGIIVSGFLAAFIVLLAYVTGFWLALVGRRAAEQWVFQLHLISVFLFVSLVLLHVLGHWWFMPKSRVRSIPSFAVGQKYTWIGIIILPCIIFGIDRILYWYQAHHGIPETITIDQYTLPYGNNPFAPSETKLSIAKNSTDQRFTHPDQIANSQQCISCHADIGQQWQESIHKASASDPTYVRNINLLVENKGIAAARYCEGCHAPVALLTGELTKGGQHGGTPNTPAFEEGVSCLSCHGIDKVHHIKGNGSYTWQPAKRYLTSYLASLENQDFVAEASRSVEKLLIQLKPEQHKQDMLAPVQQTATMCASCHAQFMDKSMNDWGWVQMQDDYADWLSGPYSGQNTAQHGNKHQQTQCQSCHMPLVPGNDPSADENGKIKSHRFIAANYVIPTLNGHHEQAKQTIEYLQAGHLQVSMHVPPANEQRESLHSLASQVKTHTEAADYLYIGQTSPLEVIVSNTGIGHNFPAGTIDLQLAWLFVEGRDAQGRQVFSSGHMQDNTPEAQAHVYQALPVNRDGAHVWRHDLFNSIGRSFERVIPAGQSDLARYSISIPHWAESPVTIIAKLQFQKLNNRYAQWALQEQYTPVQTITLAWDSLVVPVVQRDQVQ